MSNQIQDLMPRIVSRGLLTFRQSAILPRLVNSAFGAEAAQRGDSIKVPISQPITAEDVTPSNQMPQPPDTQLSSVSVPLNNWKRAAFHLTDAEMMQIEAQAHFIPLQMAEAIHALASAVNKSVLDLYVQIPQTIGVPGKLPFQTADATAHIWQGVNAAVTARKLLNKAGAPKTGRFAVIDYDMEANALALPHFHDASKAGNTSVAMDGEMGRKFGIDWFANDTLPRPGVAVTGVKLAADVEAGASSVTATVAPTKIKAGAVFSVANAADKLFMVTDSAPVKGNRDQAKLTLAQPVPATIAANTALSFVEDVHVGLVMHRDAVALAMRPLTMGGMEAGTNGHMMSVTDPQTGLSLRLEVSRQYKQTVWEFDVLWGVALVRPELAVVLHG